MTILESQENLARYFSTFGTFSKAVVRHREDDQGNNTSWALVIMEDVGSAERVLAARPLVYCSPTGACTRR